MKNLVSSLPTPKKLEEFCSIHQTTRLIKGVVPGHTDKVCPACVEEARRNTNEREIEKFRNRRTYNRLYVDSVLTDEDVLECSFDNFEVTNAAQNEQLNRMKQIANLYLDKNFKGNTVLSGKAGTGKTHLAYSLLRYVNENADPKQSCLFIDFNELVSKIKGNFKSTSTIWKEETMIEQIGNADLVVLDDLGSESSFKGDNNESSDWNQRLLFNILNRRNRTIITSNLSGKEMKEIYNPKIVSRISKGTKDKSIVFDKKLKDYRSEQF